MAYIDLDYYNKTFHGEPVSDADFPSLLERAYEVVEEMIMYRINEDLLKDYPDKTQNLIKKAICAQIEYLDANGGSDMDNCSDLASAGLGKFNYSKSSSVDGTTSQSIYAPRARRILAATGLLYRGGGRL